MANREQLTILKTGTNTWNEWRIENFNAAIDLSGAYLMEIDLRQALLHEADLRGANLIRANLRGTNLIKANLSRAKLIETNLTGANLSEANLRGANLKRSFLGLAYLISANLIEANLIQANLGGARLGGAKLKGADLWKANLEVADLEVADLRGALLRGVDLSGTIMTRTDLSGSDLRDAILSETILKGSNFAQARLGGTIIGNTDLSEAIGLEIVDHSGPSKISTDTILLSRGKIPDGFLRGCGLSDSDVEYSKLSNPEISNEEISRILYKIYELRATQALQISPLFISYSHRDSQFVNKIDMQLYKKGVRFWRDIHDMKAGRMERQIDRAIRQNPTVLLVLSEHSASSDWVEHEVRTARQLEKDMGRDVLCPVALDDSWKSSRWPKRVMEQVMEYNILDFSAWEDDVKFEGMFRKLIDGLELFYKG